MASAEGHRPQVVIVGGTGYLGSRFVASCVAKGWKVSVARRESSSIERLRAVQQQIELFPLTEDEVFRRVRGAVLVYAATVYGRQGEAEALVHEVNFDLPRRLLEGARVAGARGAIMCDSALPEGVSPYASAKSELRRYLISSVWPFPVLNLVLQHFYGPGDDPVKFVSRMIAEARRPGAVVPMTEGHQRRDFIYVDDVTTIITQLVARIGEFSKGTHHIEVGSGSAVSIRELIALIQRIVGGDARFEWGRVPLRAGEPAELVADTARMVELGLSAPTSLDEGIRRSAL